jgi:CheY-like chemotaxis protein
MAKPILDRRTVLLVSDDAHTAEELTTALCGSGATVRVASSERAALAALHAEPIDALVCDLEIRFDALAWMKRVRTALDPDKRSVAAIAWSGAQSFLHLTPFRAAGAGFDVHLLTRSPHDTLIEYVRRLTEGLPSGERPIDPAEPVVSATGGPGRGPA